MYLKALIEAKKSPYFISKLSRSVATTFNSVDDQVGRSRDGSEVTVMLTNNDYFSFKLRQVTKIISNYKTNSGTKVE